MEDISCWAVKIFICLGKCNCKALHAMVTEKMESCYIQDHNILFQKSAWFRAGVCTVEGGHFRLHEKYM